jgi:hypothetical protein
VRPVDADRDRPARVDPVVDFADVGHRRHDLVVGNALERVGERGGEDAAGVEVTANAAERRAAAVGAAEQLGDLHRGDRKRELPAQVEAARVGGRGVDMQVPLARAGR